ncbi:MAG: NUDIX domain-containing protein [Cytophagales bacterium]|nr:MAG: NUDIX domain-containing protein [Cytophagales bacterium]
MKIFINEKTIKIVDQQTIHNTLDYKVVFSGTEELISKNLKGDVLIKNASPIHIQRLIKLLEIKKLKKLISITLATDKPEFLKDFFKDEFKIIKASGGLVVKEDKFLMIYRLGKWDLPKGKLKKKEDPLKGGKREVEEECGVIVEILEKICSTWHTYIRKDKKILKKTDWYLMSSINDAQMAPQFEENIEEVRWMTKEEVELALANSYKSIEMVFEEYHLKF